MTTTTIRTASMYALIELLQADERTTGVPILDAVTVEFPDEGYAFGDIDGNLTIPTMKVGRLAGEDTWTVPALTWAHRPGQDARAARERAEELHQVLYDIVHNSAKLGGVDGLLRCTLGGFAGPDAAVQGDGEGYVAYCSSTLEFAARIA